MDDDELKVTVTFTYNKRRDVTDILIYVGDALYDTREMPGILSHYIKKKIRTEITNDYSTRY